MAPKPGIVPLRPLGVGELLDGAIGLIRSNPKTVLGLAAIISAVAAIIDTLGVFISFELIQVPEITESSDPEAVMLSLQATLMQMAVQLVPLLVSVLFSDVASGLFMVLVAAAVLGRKLNAGQTWEMLRPRVLALIALSALLGLAGLLAVGVALGAFVAGGLAGNLPATLFGLMLFLLAIPVLIYLYIKLSLAPAILVIEAKSPWKSIVRSWHLVTGSFWRVLGITLLATIIVAVLEGVVSGLFAAMTGLAAAVSEADWLFVLGAGIATLLSGIVVLPFGAAVTGLLYTDLRIRREALDIELAAAGVDPTGDPLAPYRRDLG